jgi:uncharacterized protein YecA (UPF0149 family)
MYQRALAVPTLEDRVAVFERLADLYDEQRQTVTAEHWRQAETEQRRLLGRLLPEPAVTPSVMAGSNHKLGRNERCWCGSGLKYKRCHFDADRSVPR